MTVPSMKYEVKTFDRTATAEFEKGVGAYVRIAEPHEYSEAAWIFTRGFARDPCMNWFGGIKEMVPAYKDEPDYEAHPAAANRTLKNLYAFQSAIIKITIRCGGYMTVAVIPKEQRTSLETGKESSGELIVGATLWLKPGQTLDMPLSAVIRSGLWKVLRGWGLGGVKRVLVDFSLAVEKILEKAFKTRNLDRLDSWHLLVMVVDPLYQGKGLCSLMMKDGFERTSPKPIHLEASTAKSRDIYSRYGFQIDEEHCFGRGKVDSNGLIARKNKRTGYPEWIMTKWTYD